MYDCSLSIITSSSITDSDYYVFTSGIVTITFPAWTESTGLCGPFTYSMVVTPPATFITLTSRTISIESNDLADVGTYSI